MLSLEKASPQDGSSAEDQLREWDKRDRKLLGLPADAPLPLVCEPKIDGMSVGLTYQDGRLVQAISRGDGERGDVITAQVLASGAVPDRLEGVARGEVDLRGEIYLPRDAFAKLNAKLVASGEKALINPRNGCAGLMKRKEAGTLTGLGISGFLYGVDPQHRRHRHPRHPARGARALKLLGLAAPNPESRAVDGLEGAIGYCQSFPRAPRRIALRHRRRGGQDRRARAPPAPGRHQPRAALGHRLQVPRPKRKPTRLTGVAVQVGKTGKLTPVAELDPVFVSGTTVMRANSSTTTPRSRARTCASAIPCWWRRRVISFLQVVEVDLAKRPQGAKPVLSGPPPGPRARHRGGGGGDLHPLPQSLLSRPAARAPAPFRLARRHGHLARGPALIDQVVDKLRRALARGPLLAHRRAARGPLWLASTESAEKRRRLRLSRRAGPRARQGAHRAVALAGGREARRGSGAPLRR